MVTISMFFDEILEYLDTIGATLSQLDNVQMGRYCSIADEVKIGLGSHPAQWMSSNPFPYVQLYPCLIIPYVCPYIFF